MCDQTYSEEGFKFYDIAALLVDDSKLHTVNLCRNCYNIRVAERNDSKVTNVGWKAMIKQKVSRGRLSAAFGADVFFSGNGMQLNNCGQ